MRILAMWLLMACAVCGQVQVSDTALVYFEDVSASNYSYFADSVHYGLIGTTQYVDGIESAYINSHYSTSGNDISIGGISNHIITDFRAYLTLSAAEINEIYNRPWILTDDPDLVLRTCITTNDTYDALTGVANNYGTGADGTYSNSPTAAPWSIQMEQPQRATSYTDYSTTLVRDMSGNGHTATNNGVELAETSSGWVSEFDATATNYLDCGDSDDFSFGDGSTDSPFTFHARVNIPDTNSMYTILSKVAVGTADYEYILRVLSNGRIEASFFNSVTLKIIKNEIIDASKVGWHYYTMTYDGSSSETGIEVYRDGILLPANQSSTGAYTAMGNTTAPLRIGIYWPTFGPFDGRMGLVAVYPSELTSNDVFAISTGGTITNEPTAYWTMQPEYK